jgi:hypothetical protein
MSCGLEFFSTEVSAAPPKVIAHVPPNELYYQFIFAKSASEEFRGFLWLYSPHLGFVLLFIEVS